MIFSGKTPQAIKNTVKIFSLSYFNFLLFNLYLFSLSHREVRTTVYCLLYHILSLCPLSLSHSLTLHRSLHSYKISPSQFRASLFLGSFLKWNDQNNNKWCTEQLLQQHNFVNIIILYPVPETELRLTFPLPFCTVLPQ